MTNILATGPDDGPVLLLAHGAGAAMDSPFMTLIAELLAERGLATARFEFAYMAARRESTKRRPPPKAETLAPEYEAAVEVARQRWPERQLLIGGKSMGGRVASYIADATFAKGHCAGLVCLGYPFHPPTQPTQLRTTHLVAMACPALSVQGERDPFGSRAEVDRCWTAANDMKDEYGILKVMPIADQHGVYSFYLVDCDHNWWEVQHYEGLQHDDMFDFGDRFPMDAGTASAEVAGIKSAEKV